MTHHGGTAPRTSTEYGNRERKLEARLRRRAVRTAAIEEGLAELEPSPVEVDLGLNEWLAHEENRLRNTCPDCGWHCGPWDYEGAACEGRPLRLVDVEVASVSHLLEEWER